jgi:protein required for attachment to host cells
MLIPHGTVIAVIDGKNFELYRNGGNEGEPELTALKAPELDEHNHSGGGHHASSANPIGHLSDEDAHVSAVAQWLNSEVLGHRIEKLAVIAAPRALGELRRHYHKQLELSLVCELSKDLIGKQPPEILHALQNRK